MKNFQRAVKLGGRYRWTILGIVLSSIWVAVLWGANLGAVYPIVEVVIKKESLQQWVDKRIAKARENVLEIRAEIARREDTERASQSADNGALPQDSTYATASLYALHSQLSTENKALRNAQRLKPWIDRYLPRDPFRTLLCVVGFLMVGTCLKVAFLTSNIILVERVTQLVAFDLRKMFYRRTLRLEMNCFAQEKTSQLLSHFTHDLDGITMGVRTVFGRAMREPLKVLVCLVLSAWICWRLLLFSLVATPIAMVLINGFAKGVKRANRRAMQEMSQVYDRISESFHGILAVKAFTMERCERSRFHDVAKNYAVRAQRIVLYNSLTKSSTEVMSIGVVCLALLAGSYLALNETNYIFGIRMSQRPLTFGSLMAFFALLAGMSDPFRKLAEVYNTIQRGSAAADRVFHLADREPQIVSPKTKQPMPLPLEKLAFDDVSFGYLANCRVLNGINFEIQAGETVAIVGPNGCGKSSLLNLVSRFYDPTSGAIRWNETDLRKLPVRELRAQIGLVSQQTMLFDETVADNIRYGAPHASQQEVEAAAKRAHAHHFIEKQLADGYQTVVGPGGKRLSGGQRQRIALARAILRDPEILLLDEATSQIDVESEQLIHEALSQFVQGRTTLMITHRLASLCLADRILVLDAGNIVDMGTHQELSERCGVYQRLHELHPPPLRASA